MTDTNPSCLSHVSLGTNDLARAVSFYDAVLATVGCKRIMEHEGYVVAYGKQFPEFWVGRPHDGARAEKANGVHVAFLATSRKVVDDFHATALKAGGTSDGAPGPRPAYGKEYYGCFVRDLDGHKIEAMFWEDSSG